jgi:hypothetical protein
MFAVFRIYFSMFNWQAKVLYASFLIFTMLAKDALDATLWRGNHSAINSSGTT